MKYEKCSKEKNLTIHHLITRKLKHFIEFKKYILQRYDWKNISVLCINCHKNLHKKEENWNEELTPMNQTWIKNLKKKYLIITEK